MPSRRAHVCGFAILFAAPACNAIFGISNGEPGAGGATTTSPTSSSNTGSTTATGGSGGAATTSGSTASTSSTASSSSSSGTGGSIPCGGGGPKGDTTLFAKRTAGGNTERGTAVSFTPTNDVFWAGTYSSGDTAFGATALPYPTPDGSTEDADVFITRYSSAGLHLWSKGYGGPLDQLPFAMIADPNADVIVTGSMEGSFDLGGTVLVASGLDGFVTKLHGNDGTVMWARAITGSGDEIGETVGVDGDGDVIVAGVTNGTVDVGCGAMDTPAGAGVFMAKLDKADGHCIWSHKYSADTRFYNKDTIGYRVSLAVDPNSDDIYLTGGAAGPNFGQGPAAAFGDKDVFVFKATGNGDYVDVRTFGSVTDDGTQYATGVALDTCGHVFLAGAFHHSLTFGGTTLTTKSMAPADADQEDVFVVKLDASLAPMWAKSFGDVGFQIAVGVGVDAQGNVVLGGNLVDAAQSIGVDFGGGPLLGLGDYTPGTYAEDVFAAKLDPSGSYVWAKRWGTRSYDVTRAFAVSPSSRVAIAGGFLTDSTPSLLDFGGASQPIGSSYIDGFLAVVGP